MITHNTTNTKGDYNSNNLAGFLQAVQPNVLLGHSIKNPEG